MTHRVSKRAVALRELPQGVEFPPSLQGRIVYHAERGQLEFDGFMSKTDYDRLYRLSNELAYQRALEELFRKCTFEDAEAKPRGRLAKLTVAAAVATAAVSLIVGFSLR